MSSRSALPQGRVWLDVTSGPLKGRSFDLGGEAITIGREPSNPLAFRDASVSRQHCRIERRDDAYYVVDLESRNGTLVNGEPVTEAKVAPGDEITVGNCAVIFRTEGDTAPEAALSDATVFLRRDESLYLRAGALPATERTVRDLDVLFNFSRVVGTLRTVDQIVEKVVEVSKATTSAEKVVVRLCDEDGEIGPGVSRTIVARVIGDGVTVLSNDIAGDEGLQAAHSLSASRIRSVLAVPLSVLDRVVGLIYLDSTKPGALFDEPLMHLMTAVGSIAALGIENARHLQWLTGENQRLQKELDVKHSMIGESAAIKDVYQFIARVAPSEATVLVTGESGTGKELVARAIHQNSKRAERPFVTINCGAFVETLLESELFGHEKGAFTGAVAQKKGKLELGEGGTVFLDEIGEVPMLLQVKLLRVLQQREFERVGGTRVMKLDIRLVAATNRDLRAEVRAGRFREDLYYRLNVVSVKMPPLRDRRDDVPLLASYFAVRSGESMGRKISGIAPKARACMMRYDWPGNVRELENAIERAVVMGSGEVIQAEDLPESVLELGVDEDQPVSALHDAVLEAKRGILTQAIEKAGGNYTDAAKALGVHPNHFFRLIRTLNLKPKRQRNGS